MALTCPACSAALPGFTTEATLKERLAEQKAAHSTVMGDLSTKAAAAEADLSRLRPLAERAEALDRDLAYTRAGIPDAQSRAVETLYRGYRAEAGDAALDRAAWLADEAAQADYAPMIRAVRGVAAAPPPAAPATPPAPGTPAAPAAPRASTLPPANAGVANAPAAPAKPMTVADRNAELARRAADPNFRRLPAEERRKAHDGWKAELDARVEAPAASAAT